MEDEDFEDSEGYGEAALYNWFWALSRYIAEGAHLDYLPSSVGASISFHYDKEKGESQKHEYSYSEPYKEDITDDDLNVETDFIEYNLDEDNKDFNEEEFDLNLEYGEDDYTRENE